MAKKLAKLLMADINATSDLAEIAKMLQSKGRGNDTILAHITKREAERLKRDGGSGTINPETGLLEFDDYGSYSSSAPTFGDYSMADTATAPMSQEQIQQQKTQQEQQRLAVEIAKAEKQKQEKEAEQTKQKQAEEDERVRQWRKWADKKAAEQELEVKRQEREEKARQKAEEDRIWHTWAIKTDKIEAKFMGMVGKRITLKTREGDKLIVSFDDLNPEDKYWIYHH